MATSTVRRVQLEQRVLDGIRNYPVTAIIGPRQCGKTTLAQQIASGRRAHYFDLESPVGFQRLENPDTALRPLRGLVVIDEIQRKPDLFPLLRVLADRHPLPARFLILGSASPDLIRHSSESLAGRISFVDMAGFDLAEVGDASQRRLWWRGGFPRSFLARTERLSLQWRENFIQTFLERDLRQLGILVPPVAMRRFWYMLAHYHGQVWNASELSRSLGESYATVKRHLDMLTGALMVRQLPPWFENLGKRQVKAPKVYLRDPGILHSLLGLSTFAQLEANPKRGSSWEGFVIEHILRLVGDRNAYYWATHAGAELDLMLLVGGRRYGVEVKYSDAPALTKSMHVAITDLRLERLFVVYPGTETYRLSEKAEVVPLRDIRKRFERGPAGRTTRLRWHITGAW